MKKLIFILFATAMALGNINICLAEAPEMDDFDKGLIIKGDTTGNEMEPMRQIDKLIKGGVDDSTIKLEFDSSLGVTKVVIKNNNSVVKGTQVNTASKTNLVLNKSDLGKGDFTVEFTDEDGSKAYTSFTIE